MFGPHRRRPRCAWPTTDLWIRGGTGLHRLWREVKFGGGKVIRDGMGQSQLGAAQVVEYGDHQCTDPRPLGAWSGRRRSQDGRIQAIGKASNPDIQPGVNIAIGAGTEVIAGEGMIPHRRRHRHAHPLHLPAADRRGADERVTTMIGGGTGPAAGINATTCTSGPWHMARMLQAADAFPMNIGSPARATACRCRWRSRCSPAPSA